MHLLPDWAARFTPPYNLLHLISPYAFENSPFLFSKPSILYSGSVDQMSHPGLKHNA